MGKRAELSCSPELCVPRAAARVCPLQGVIAAGCTGRPPGGPSSFCGQLLLSVPSHSIGLLLSSLHRFPWPTSRRVWSSSPSSSRCWCRPASLSRGGFRLEAYPSTTASSQLPSRTAPGRSFSAWGVLCPSPAARDGGRGAVGVLLSSGACHARWFPDTAALQSLLASSRVASPSHAMQGLWLLLLCQPQRLSKALSAPQPFGGVPAAARLGAVPAAAVSLPLQPVADAAAVFGYEAPRFGVSRLDRVWGGKGGSL